MKQMDSLYSVLEEILELYSSFVKVEYEKYDAVVRNNIEKLDEIISKEQVFYLKAKGLEQRRVRITDSMNIKDKTLTEIIEITGEDESARLKLLRDRLNNSLADFKKINSECKTLIDVRLHRIDTVMSKLGERDNTYTNGENRKNNLNSFIVSKKI